MCSQCGSAVADNAAFCGHCRAPQIRVKIESEPAAPHPQSSISVPAVESAPGNAGTMPLSVSVYVQTAPSEVPVNVAQQKTPIHWSKALPRTAMVGFFTTIAVMIFHFPFLVFLLLPVGGAMGTWMYAKSLPHGQLTTGQGAVLGACTGFFSFLFYLIVLMATVKFAREELMKIIRDAMQQSIVSNPDPNAQKMMQQMMQYFSTPEGFAVVLAFVVVVIFIFFIFLCMSGGAISAKLARRKR